MSRKPRTSEDPAITAPARLLLLPLIPFEAGAFLTELIEGAAVARDQIGTTVFLLFFGQDHEFLGKTKFLGKV